MAGAATHVREYNDIRKTAVAAIIANEIHQLADGSAGYKKGLAAAILNDAVGFETRGQVNIPKTASIVILDGGRVYWDRSAGAAHYKKVNDRDFYVGRAVGDAASADTSMTVNLNIDPPADIDLLKHPALSSIVGTAAAGGFGYPVPLGGSTIFELTATNEAQKVDLMSVDGFSKDANAIVDYEFRVISDGAGTVVDVSIGIANGTHASDADVIAESIFVHLDANNTNINLESDDGTIEVPATDSTLDYTEGSAVANRVFVTIDMRNPADVQIYINGVLALTATVFNVNVAAGPLFMLVHLEKTVSTDAYKLAIDRATARFAEQ